jgi:ABC-type lipoprotein release transport system permease subunit
MHNLETDPLNLELMGNLVLGAIASLFLTWLGCLIASWMNARQRALSFGILRALGSTPQQLKKVLLWEQTFVYGTATLLGILLGLLMALLTLPSLILTSKLPQNSTVDLFSLQNTPPMHTVIPASLILVIGLLAALAIVSVWLMNRVVAWVSLPQTLRLNED